MSTDALEALSSVISVAIAAIALAAAFRSERRANQQFRENIRLQREVIELSHKPVLTLGGLQTKDSFGIVLKNVGNGTAIITKTTFRVEGRENSDITKVLQFPKEHLQIWENSYIFSPQRPSYVSSGERITLASVSRSIFEEFGVGEEDIEKTIERMYEQMRSIEAVIEYTDILGNQQPACTRP